MSGILLYGNSKYSFQAKMEVPRKDNEKNIIEMAREGLLGGSVD